MSPIEEAKAYQTFFYKSEAGENFMQWLDEMERGHIKKAQENYDTHELAASVPFKEIRDYITSVIAQTQQ